MCPPAERQPEPLHPAAGRPDLLCQRNVCDVVILDPGQVPNQPGDRVRAAVDPERQLLRRQPANDVVDGLLDPAERVGEKLSAGHRVALSSGVFWSVPSAGLCRPPPHLTAIMSACLQHR
jgi:hypothetical protein